MFLESETTTLQAISSDKHLYFTGEWDKKLTPELIYSFHWELK